jgi:hypothetical protein
MRPGGDSRQHNERGISAVAVAVVEIIPSASSSRVSAGADEPVHDCMKEFAEFNARVG